MRLVQLFDVFLEKVSKYGLIACLFIILGFSVVSIVLRWIGSSEMWIEPLIRHFVFLSAFLGGSLATSKDVHIKIDLLTKLVERSHSKILHWLHRNLLSLFCFIVCLILTKTSWDFFLIEKEFGVPAFLNIHSAYLVGIIPLGMGLIALRFFNRLMLGILTGDKLEHHHL